MTFSLMHPTARLPDGWKPAWLEWSEKADHPNDCEYILVLDTILVSELKLPSCPLSINGERTILIFPIMLRRKDRTGCVSPWNVAAGSASGDVMVCVADDFFPCPHWDTLLLDAIGDVRREAVVWVDAQDNNPEIMTHPILTKAYYDKPGRGGMPHGELFYPEYLHFGCDDDFTEYSSKELGPTGGVIDCRKTIHFEHRHPDSGTAPNDAMYRWHQRQETWDRKHEVLPRRQACGFTR